jgi:hypothetical protein
MSSSPPLGPGTAISDDPFWLETIKHQGISAFNPNPSSYQVFRNVKDFGAKGDGIIDDTAAIKYATGLLLGVHTLADFWAVALLYRPAVVVEVALAVHPRSCCHFYNDMYVYRFGRVSPAIVYFPAGYVQSHLS